MYERYFSFKEKPFELVPNPDYLFLSATHKKAMTFLDYGIREKIGFILLTGEIGSGKTTILRNFIKKLNGSVKLSRVNNTKVSSEQLIALINEDFGLDVQGKNKTKLLSDLNEFLIEQYANHHQTILLLDEAQNLSADLLEEVRLLSNLETDKAKLLQIILVGQPELKKTLMLRELTQLRQRISINYHITPLTIEETEKYIQHRLVIAGNPDAIRIGNELLAVIYRFSRGIPRLINIICDFALLSAFVEKKDAVDSRIVKDVAKDLESYDYWQKPQSDSVESEQQEQKNQELMETIGNLALRLIAVEEKLKQSFSALESLTNKVNTAEAERNKFERRILGQLAELLAKQEEKLVCQVLLRLSENSDAVTLSQRVSEIKGMGDDLASRCKIDGEPGPVHEIIQDNVRDIQLQIEALEKKISILKENINS